MSWIIRLLMVLVVVAGLSQAVVPNWLGSELAHQLQKVSGPGSRDQVTVTAVPFWMLANGQFQDLHIQVRNWTAGPLPVAALDVNWQDGGVNTQDLVTQKALVVARAGRMEAVLKVDGPGLEKFLARSGRISHPRVTVGSQYLTVAGRVSLNGLSGPINTQGTLSVAPNRRQLIFRPRSVDGLGLPFPANFVVFDVNQLNLPVALEITAVKLEPPYVVVWAKTP